MEGLKEYVKNIDFDVVDEPEVLDNVYMEIHGHEGELILNTETTYQMERLIRKSSGEQILGLFGRLDVRHLINKKLGSRVIEVVYDVVFDMAYVQKQDIDTLAITEATEEHLGQRILDVNATHVVRKLFQLVSGKRMCKDGVERFTPTDPSRIHRYKQTVVEVIPRLSREDSFMTVLCYLHCHRSQTVIHEAVMQHFSWTRVCEPSMSYFFEGLARMAGRRSLKHMFEEVKERVMELCRDRYGNYFIGELILRCHDRADHFFDSLDLAEFHRNSNVVMKLVQSLQKAGSHEKISEVMRMFGVEDGEDAIVTNTFGGEEGNFKQKYAPMLCGFMRLPEIHGYGVNRAFRRRFDVGWLRSKGGVELLQGYYEGTDSKASKREFTRRLEKHLPWIVKRKGCGRALRLMMEYASPGGAKMIRQALMGQDRNTTSK